VAASITVAAVDRRGFRDSNRDRVTAVIDIEGLPLSDEQKKTRLLSHLSA
jgi:hypothetical protein